MAVGDGACCIGVGRGSPSMATSWPVQIMIRVEVSVGLAPCMGRLHKDSLSLSLYIYNI